MEAQYVKETGDREPISQMEYGLWRTRYVTWLESKLIESIILDHELRQNLTRLSGDLLRFYGTDSYAERCLIFDIREQLKKRLESK